MGPEPTRGGIVAGAVELARSLPPAFLGLCLINALFLAAVFWHEGKRDELRTRIVEQMLSACLPPRPR